MPLIVPIFILTAGDRSNPSHAIKARSTIELEIMKTRPLHLTALLIAICAGCGGFGLSSCAKKTQSIVIAYAPFQSLVLLWTAAEQGFFNRNGLNVTLREFPTGAGALDGVLSGQADIAVGPAEFPLVGKAFKKEKVRILGTIDKLEHINVVARQDRGITGVPDLRGKSVGTTRGTIAEFYLGRMIELNGMDLQDLNVVDLKTPTEWVDAVVNGDVDAVVTAQPYADFARDGLGPNAVVWSAQNNQPMFALLVSTDQWINAHPEWVERFLRSFLLAEEFVIRNPSAARAIMQKRLNLKAADVETAWAQNQYGLSLDQSLITAMEDEARWMIKNGLTDEENIPDFPRFLYLDALEAVKPEAVNIIR